MTDWARLSSTTPGWAFSLQPVPVVVACWLNVWRGDVMLYRGLARGASMSAAQDEAHRLLAQFARAMLAAQENGGQRLA